MCYNLGADYDLDPFTLAKGLNGSYYQWNRKVPVADVNTPTPYPGTWDSTGDITATEWTASNDPCPAGFRVPTQAEWQGINDTRNTATNAPGSTWADDGNFISGKFMGSFLYLPATGGMTGSGGFLGHRGILGYYWSSIPSQSELVNAYTLVVGNGFPLTASNDYSRASGCSVRCIAGNY
jgi:uncharacterized protein (TIGR02145 family)